MTYPFIIKELSCLRVWNFGLTAKGAVTRRQVDFPVRNPHRFGPFHGPDASSVHYPGAQDTRASLCHNPFQSVAP